MDVMEAIKSRRSIRRFKDLPIEQEKLLQVLEAGRLAPSANNQQDWNFVVVRDADLRQKLAEVCHEQAFIGEAPVVIVACTTNASRIMRSGYQCAAVDLSIAVAHMTLAAVALGLGSCWIGAFDTNKVAAVLGLPQGLAPVHVVPLGYPVESPAARPRKSLDEVVIYK
jgi:nitroreductase